MKRTTAIILSLICLFLTACSDKIIQIEETTETLKVSVTSERVTTKIETITETATESSTLATTETEIITETTADKNEETEEELDFWICPVPDDGYIITDSADMLTIKKLYPLICKAFDYMICSYNSFYLNEENVYEEIESYAEQEGEKYSEVFTWNLIDQIPKPNEKDVERGYYTYSISFLSGSADEGYICGDGRGTDSSYLCSDWQINVISDNEVQLIHKAFYSAFPEWIEGDELVYFKDHMLLNQADDSIHQLRTVDNRSERLETYYYTLLWEDEHWKFDSFSLWQ